MSTLQSIKIKPSARTEPSEDYALTQKDRIMTSSMDAEASLNGAYQDNIPKDPHLTLPPIKQDRRLSRKKSQYYENAFAIRSPHHSARERVLRDSVVLADMVTNADIENEYTFITDLSYNLSNRYQRSESSIFCTLNHSNMLIFEGSFEPCYILTITAHPSLLQPVTNKRNATLFAKGMEEALNVPASRGLIRFVPAAEDCYAIRGKTLGAEIEELEWEERAKPEVTKKKSSMSALRSMSLRTSKVPELPTTQEETHEGFTPPATPRDDAHGHDSKAEKERKIRGRKSFASVFFGR